MAKKSHQISMTGDREFVEVTEDGQPLRCDNPGVPPEAILEATKPPISPTAGMIPPILSQKPRKPMPKTDPELQAMARIDRILAELDGNQKRRVVEWIRDRFGPQPHYPDAITGFENTPESTK